MPRTLAALNLPRRASDTLFDARSMGAAMRGNPAFPLPEPPLATFEADKRSSGHAKPDFVAKRGPVPGTARLVAKAARTRASYDWQRSTDGETWVDVERTVRADAEVRDLVAATRYLFRYRTVTNDGVGDFSQVVSLLVL